MKTADYIAQFLAGQGVSTAFCLTGGCIVHALDSIATLGKTRLIPVQHEQAGAMAADAHARISGEFGVMLTTSGPGATNLLTGVCCSYYDSIPVLLITGQVPSNQLKGNSGSRQIGFQETDVISIFKSVTKAAIQIYDPAYVPFALHKAVRIARHGRPGPVLLDICDDVQRAELPEFVMDSDYSQQEPHREKPDLSAIPDLLNGSSRPLLILGGGIRRADIPLAIGFAERHGMPFTLTWAARDFCSHDHPLFAGGFGVTSGRAGNFAVQNADLLLCIGTRLDTHETGSDLKQFAPEAVKVIVDLDPAEQEKYKARGMEATLITADSHDVLEGMDGLWLGDAYMAWRAQIHQWRSRYRAVTEEMRAQRDYVNPYVFMEELSKQVDEDAIIVTDCGSNLIWTMQAFKVRKQRIISAWNHSPMGYSLPAAIGASLAAPGKQVVCIIGDGGFQVNVQELATIAKLNLPIKIFVMNNKGHGIIQGTQDAWLEGRHVASAEDLPQPAISDIADAYGIETFMFWRGAGAILDSLTSKGPALTEIELRPGSQIEPKLMYGRPLHDSHPLLPRHELESQML